MRPAASTVFPNLALRVKSLPTPGIGSREDNKTVFPVGYMQDIDADIINIGSKYRNDIEMVISVGYRNDSDWNNTNIG